MNAAQETEEGECQWEVGVQEGALEEMEREPEERGKK